MHTHTRHFFLFLNFFFVLDKQIKLNKDQHYIWIIDFFVFVFNSKKYKQANVLYSNHYLIEFLSREKLKNREKIIFSMFFRLKNYLIALIKWLCGAVLVVLYRSGSFIRFTLVSFWIFFWSIVNFDNQKNVLNRNKYFLCCIST